MEQHLLTAVSSLPWSEVLPSGEPEQRSHDCHTTTHLSIHPSIRLTYSTVPNQVVPRYPTPSYPTHTHTHHPVDISRMHTYVHNTYRTCAHAYLQLHDSRTTLDPSPHNLGASAQLSRGPLKKETSRGWWSRASLAVCSPSLLQRSWFATAERSGTGPSPQPALRSETARARFKRTSWQLATVAAIGDLGLLV